MTNQINTSEAISKKAYRKSLRFPKGKPEYIQYVKLNIHQKINLKSGWETYRTSESHGQKHLSPDYFDLMGQVAGQEQQSI